MSPDPDEIAWADALAKLLPPFTASEAAAVGRQAAVLDGRQCLPRKQNPAEPARPTGK